MSGLWHGLESCVQKVEILVFCYHEFCPQKQRKRVVHERVANMILADQNLYKFQLVCRGRNLVLEKEMPCRGAEDPDFVGRNDLKFPLFRRSRR